MRMLIRNVWWKHFPVLLSAMAIFLISTPYVQSSDEHAVQAPLAARSILLDGCFAGNRIVAVGERGHVLLSDDQGVSWRQASQVPSQATLTGVYFQNENLGFAVGHDAVILKTEDKGESWKLVYSAPEEERPFLDVLFLDINTGFAVGAYGFFLTTHNSGKTWTSEYISEDDYHFNQIAQSSGGTLFIAGESGKIYVSKDKGDNWQDVVSPYSGSFFGVLPLRDGPSLFFGLRGSLFRYREQDNFWDQVSSPIKVLLNDGHEMANGNIVVVGMAGTILISKDKGKSFIYKPQSNRLSISAVIQARDGALILIGEYGARRFDWKIP